MATNYPGSLDTSSEQPSPSASTEMDDAGFEHDVVHTNHSGAIIALETKVGTGSSTAVADSVLAGTGSGTSAWSTSPSLSGLTVDGDIEIVGAARTINFGSLDEGGPHGLEVAPSGTLESALYYRTSPLSWSFEDGSGGKIAEFVSGTLSTAFDTDTLYVDGTNDRVGINTSSPSNHLTVASPSGNASAQIMAASGSYPQLFFGDGGTNQWHIESTPSGGALYFVETGVGYPLTILPGNKVGIADTTPSYTLDVNGIIRATSYIRTDSGNNVHVSLNATSTTSRPYIEIDHYNGSTYRRAGYMGYPESNASGAHMQMVADNGFVNFWAGGYGNGLRVGNPTGSYGTVETSGEGKNGWEGYSINGWAVFMANSSTGNFGIYDDVNNEWALYCDFNGSCDLRYNGSAKATTTNGGLLISGDVYVSGNDVVFGGTSANDYIRYSDGAQGAMGGRFEFVADGSSANSQIVAGTGIFLRDSSLSTHDNYQDSTGDYNVITAVNHTAGSGNNWVDMTIICEDDDSVAFVGTAFHADHHNYAPIWRSTTSGGEGLACRTNTEGAFARLLASAFQVNSTEDSKQEIVDAPPLLQRFRDYVATGHHTKQFRRKEVANPTPAYELKYAAIERDYGTEEADRWLEDRTLQNIWTRTDADWLELDKMQNGVEFTEFGVVIDEFGPAFPEVASWESNEDGTEMVPVGLDLSSAIGFLMRLVEDLDEENQTLEARVAALEAA